MKNKGIVFGTFDLLHVGHVSLFKGAKQYCKELIVAVHVDPSIERANKNKPIESLIERCIKVNSNKYVDGVICYEKEIDILTILQYIKPDVRFLGTDYGLGMKEISYQDEVEIIFIDTINVHTTDVRERFKYDNK